LHRPDILKIHAIPLHGTPAELPWAPTSRHSLFIVLFVGEEQALSDDTTGISHSRCFWYKQLWVDIDVNNVTAKTLQLPPSGGKLVQKGQSDLGEFEGVAPAESADGGRIAGRVDDGVVVSGYSLEHHGGWVSVLIPACVVRAGVATRGIVGGGQLAVGADQGPGESVGSAVDVVGLDGDDLGGSRLEAVKGWEISVCSLMRPGGGENVLGSHVELHESLDRSSGSGVAGGDSLGTEETGFLAGIEVDLEWGGGLEARGNQNTEDLHGIYGTGTILPGRNGVSITDKRTNISK